MEGIYVEECCRRKGTAKALLAACEEWARSKGCAEFTSDCELTNADSQRFHQILGFTEANRIVCFTKKLQRGEENLCYRFIATANAPPAKRLCNGWIEHQVIDIKNNHPDEETLRRYYAVSGLPLKRFFNTSGIQYREQELSKELPNMSEDEQLRLLASDGLLVKRPLLIGEGFVLIGFKETEWAEKLL